MDQPVVNYNLVDNLTWSDGQPVTAADSVYSYELAADDDTPVGKTYTNLTASYTALDDSTVQWIGKPGLVTPDLENYFWMPLPQHLWDELSAAELLDSDLAARSPVGWGPYQLDEWTAGDHMRLSKNPYYYRAGEGLPQYDYLYLKFISSGDFGAASDGTCDIVAGDALSLDQVAANAAAWPIRITSCARAIPARLNSWPLASHPSLTTILITPMAPTVRFFRGRQRGARPLPCASTARDFG